VSAGTFVCVLLNSEEVLDSVPRDDHDLAVTAVATEEGVRRIGP
jgi:5-formyltetrahydrofolate cyclo-ligase